MAMEFPRGRESIDVGDGFDSPHPSPHTVDVESPPLNQDTEADREKLLPRVSRRRAQDKQAALLETSFIRSLLSFSWLIHVIALGCTAAAVRLSFASTYWVDEADWNNRFLFSILRGTRIQDVLQFAAKLYEIIIVTSVSAMVLHILRRMLVGDGIPFGLMSGSYQVGAPLYLFSRELWSPLIRPGNYRNFLMGVVLAFLVIYCNMIGPFTAIIITPILEWWPMADPYNGEKLTTYIHAANTSIYPQLVDENTINADDCPDYTTSLCPASGLFEVKNLLEAWATSNAKPSLQVKHTGAETSRELVSSLDYSTPDSHMAIATTLQSSIVELAGVFWNYIDSNVTVGDVKDAKRPRFTPSLDNVYAPIVQVQCSQYSYNALGGSGGTPKFHTDRLRNFSSYYILGEEDSYRSTDRIDVPSELWDVERDTDSLREITFQWVDTWRAFSGDRPSLAAYITVPMTRHIPNARNSSAFDQVQDSLLIPCVIDARWAGVSTNYDPTNDNLMPSNISDLSVFAPYWNDGNSRPGSLTLPNIDISPEWANLLNVNTGDVESVQGTQFNGPAMEWMLKTFRYNDLSKWDNEDEYFKSFKTGNFSNEKVDRSEFDDDAARAVATTLSLAVADGLSRVSLWIDIGLVTQDFGNGNMSYKGLWLQNSGGENPAENQTTEFFENKTPIEWKVERKGWGYGFRTPTIIAGVVIMLFHAGLVLAFSVYVVLFRLRSHGWASGAWGGLSEMMGLALVSRQPRNTRVVGEIAEGEDKWGNMRTNVCIRTYDQEGIELVLVDKIYGAHDTDAYGSRLTVGRSYSS